MNSTNLITNLLVAFKTSYLNNNKYAYTKYNKIILNVLYVLYKDGLISGYQILVIDNKVKIKLKMGVVNNNLNFLIKLSASLNLCEFHNLILISIS